jgi:hypothetical protein
VILQHFSLYLADQGRNRSRQHRSALNSPGLVGSKPSQS